MHPPPEKKRAPADLSNDDWKGTDLPGRQVDGKPQAGPHQGLPGQPIDPAVDEDDEPEPGGDRDEV